MGGYHTYVAWTRIASQAVSLVLAFALIGPYGLVGVAMASFIAEVPFQVGAMQIRAGLIHRRWHPVFYAKTLLPSVVPAALMTGTILGLEQVWEVNRLAEVAALELLAIGVFGVSFWLVGLSREERAYFADRLLRRGKKGDEPGQGPETKGSIR